MRALTAPLAGRRRVVVALAGAGLVAAGFPAVAAGGEPEQAAALVLLVDAAQASRALTYTGTQYVATWGPATTTSLLEVQHAPGRGVQVRHTAEAGDADPVVLAGGVMDERLLDVLRDRYELRLAGEGRCTGRAAHVVEAHRPGVHGAAAVAGRFWVDRDTGLLLRREVFDGQGRRLRSSAFLDLSITTPPATPPSLLLRPPAADDADAGNAVPAARLGELREAGQVVPAQLPGGFVLFEARSKVHDGAEVLHLAYSDGLSTTSLFSQPGRLGSAPPEDFAPRTVAGEPVWASSGAPQRMVWAGAGRVWTLVSDAPADSVEQAVGTLPHAAMPDDDPGWRARLARGAARLASAVNPFS